MHDDQIIGQAIVFIENHLYEPIAACDVAKEVSYSYHHFHRYFSAVMGETIGSYIRSRRLTQAAWELTHSKKKIIDIGHALYFETAESFTRAFKKRYGITPTAYRKNGLDVLLGSRQSARKANDNTIITYAGLHPEIVSIPTVQLMGIRFQTTIHGNESIAMWQLFNTQIPSSLSSNKRYGVFEAGACSSDLFHLDSRTTAFVGIEIPENYSIPKDMQVKHLYGGKYAKFTHKGRVDTLIQTYHYIWGVWFPKSGFELADRDDFECYTERFTGMDQEDSEIDIYFPVD